VLFRVPGVYEGSAAVFADAGVGDATARVARRDVRAAKLRMNPILIVFIGFLDVVML
jgi:hypothetical protein